jgi:peptide/nickel transport system permease protein
VFILVLLAFTAIFAPWISPEHPLQQNLRARNVPPIWNFEYHSTHTVMRQDNSAEQTYILGADNLGRDVLSRIIYGARLSMAVVSVSLVAGTVVGLIAGVVAGYYGGLVDELIMRLVDVWQALPFLLIAILAAITFGQSVNLIMILLALAAWGGGVRNVRAEILYLKELDYVAISRIAGASPARIMVRHLLPGVFSTIMVLATLRAGGLILAEASLSYLGAGVPSSTVTWGSIIADGSPHLINGVWWIAVLPGLAIFLVVMAINFFGDWLRDRLDPRLRQL